ncbi:class I SAM-dependent methyltransferase [Candidatus Woesearchaeota archaeon]|nr:class I SAM-dependent methyltransferase [Candidatus Woesearchaeota archaeon]
MNNDSLVDLIESETNYLRARSKRSKRVLEAMRKVDRGAFLPDVPVECFFFEPNIVKKLRDQLLSGSTTNSKESTEEQLVNLATGAVKLLINARTLTVSLRALAYNNIPLPIGYEQTCSQPSMVAFMCDELELQPGMKVLEVGTGCGYHAAIASELVSPGGKVVSIEIIPELHKFAKENLIAYFGEREFHNRFKLICGDGSMGAPEEGPFDRIYLTAGVEQDRFKPEVLAEQLSYEGGMLLFPEAEGKLILQCYSSGKKVEEREFTGVRFVALKGENT